MTESRGCFAKRIRHLRLAKGLTVQEVAERVGVAISTYREWEYGRSVRGEPYEKLAEILGVSIHELLTGSSANKNKALSVVGKMEHLLNELKNEMEKFL